MALGMQALSYMHYHTLSIFHRGTTIFVGLKLSHIVYPHLMQLTLALDKTIKLAPIKRGLMNGTEGLTASSLLQDPVPITQRRY